MLAGDAAMNMSDRIEELEEINAEMLAVLEQMMDVTTPEEGAWATEKAFAVIAKAKGEALGG